jgi:hypothetical protein
VPGNIPPQWTLAHPIPSLRIQTLQKLICAPSKGDFCARSKGDSLK